MRANWNATHISLRRYILFIDQARGQHDWISAKFTFGLLVRDRKWKLIKTKKKNRPISSYVDQTSLVNK